MTTALLPVTAAVFHGAYLAEVVAVNDPESLARVQVRLLGFDGVPNQDAPLWARVAVPFAGADRGAFFLPDVGDEVLVSFVGGDPRLPVVVGGLWNGSARAHETLGGNGTSVDRWTITGKAGTRIAIVEERAGEATVRLSTPGGVSAELTEAGGGKIELAIPGTTITVDSAGVSVRTSGTVQVNASTVDVSAMTVNVDAGVASFSGMVTCRTLQADTVIGATYTPGAGNVW